MAKIDFRLVMHQDPERISRLLRRHLNAHGFVDIAMRASDGMRAACVDPEDPFVAVAMDALREVYEAEPSVVPMVGGTGPATYFMQELNVPFVSVGCSYPGGCKHAPNENIRLDDFIRGAAAIATIMERAALASC